MPLKTQGDDNEQSIFTVTTPSSSAAWSCYVQRAERRENGNIYLFSLYGLLLVLRPNACAVKPSIDFPKSQMLNQILFQTFTPTVQQLTNTQRIFICIEKRDLNQQLNMQLYKAHCYIYFKPIYNICVQYIPHVTQLQDKVSPSPSSAYLTVQYNYCILLYIQATI